MSYLDYPFVEDPDAILTRILGNLQVKFPGFVPLESHIVTAMVEEFAREQADTRALAVDVAAAIFRAFGRSVIGLQSIDPVPATIPVTFALSDTLGHTIPTGTRLAYTGPTGSVAFQTTAPVVVVAGSTTGTATLAALVGGVAGNGVPTGPLQLLDSLAYVNTVTATAVSGGGLDGETDEAYTARLAEDLTTIGFKAVLPGDVAILTRNVPGVFRALGINGYNPTAGATPVDGNARTVAVVPLDATGRPVPSAVASLVQSTLASYREVNFQFFVTTPTYTAVTLTYQVLVEAGSDPVAVNAAANAAASRAIDPAVFSGGNLTPPKWTGDAAVRYLAVSQIIGAVPGVHRVIDLTLNGARVDLTLAGHAPLPAPQTNVPGGGAASTVTGTAVTS